nr:immunoglobulin heavy chain junction region [Mus musculus]
CARWGITTVVADYFDYW